MIRRFLRLARPFCSDATAAPPANAWMKFFTERPEHRINWSTDLSEYCDSYRQSIALKEAVEQDFTSIGD
jgi:hypothetical protein